MSVVFIKSTLNINNLLDTKYADEDSTTVPTDRLLNISNHKATP